MTTEKRAKDALRTHFDQFTDQELAAKLNAMDHALAAIREAGKSNRGALAMRRGKQPR